MLTHSFGYLSHFEKALEKVLAENTKIFHQPQNKTPISGQLRQQVSSFSPHCCRPSCHHPLLTKVFAWIVYTDLTFTSRSSLTFPSCHNRDRVAGRPSYVAGQRGVPRLIGTAAVTHRMGEWQGRWLRGVAPGSIRPFLAR